MPNVLVVGCGDLGQYLATCLPADRWRLLGARRNPECLPPGIQRVPLDVTSAASVASLQELEFEHVVVTLTPAGRSEAGYREVFDIGLGHLLDVLAARPPRSLLFVSSTAVYHQDDGSWVDESSLTRPRRYNGQVLLQAEQRLEGWPGAVILRPGGIYGPGRGALLRRVARGEIAPAQPLRYTNRIHRDDLSGFMAHLLHHAEAGTALEPCYCVVDSDPAPAHEVETWLAKRLGVTPSAISSGTSDPVRGANKRVSNRRLLHTGYVLRYPGYRQGYAALLEQGSGQAVGSTCPE